MKFATTGQLDNGNCVNRAVKSADLSSVSVIHRSNVGVLAHIFSVFANEGFNMQELENIPLKDRQASIANMTFTTMAETTTEGIASVKAKLLANENILNVKF